ncbi:hypothetical protein TNCV_1586801 [Trichonephila clavipes]|nr:hypothetical protein TNCV_1586801 [Trichonephila clavipes]
MCIYSPNNRAPISKNGSKGILIQGPLRASYVTVLQQIGLPQRAVIIFTMFDIMINEVIMKLWEIPGIKYLAFADDMVIYTNRSDFTTLNKSINDA